MELSIADYLLQLPENMHFAKVQELSGEGSIYYRMLSEYGSGSFQLIRFENDLLMILIADYTPKETFEKIATISEEYMEISQFETDSSSFKIGRRKTQPVGKGIYCYVNTQKTTYVYCEKGKPVRFTKIILTRKYFDTYFRVHYGKDYEQSKVAKEYLLKNPNLPELNFVFQQIRDCQAVGQTLHLYLESKVLELLSLVIKGMEQKENHISVKLDYKDIRDLKKTDSAFGGAASAALAFRNSKKAPRRGVFRMQNYMMSAFRYPTPMSTARKEKLNARNLSTYFLVSPGQTRRKVLRVMRLASEAMGVPSPPMFTATSRFA